MASSTKALARLELNIITISLMNSGPCPKNNVMKSLLGGEKQMVWVKVKVKASLVGAKVTEEVIEGGTGRGTGRGAGRGAEGGNVPFTAKKLTNTVASLARKNTMEPW